MCIIKSEVKKSQACENDLNKILRHGRFGNNVEEDQNKVADVANNQKWVSPNTATKLDKRVEKHLQMLEEHLEEVHELKGKIQELKLKQEKNMEKIEKWTSKNEAEIQGYDAPIEELQNRIIKLKPRETQERKAEVDQFEEECLQRRYNEERELETMEFEVRQAIEKKAEMSSEKNARENPVKVELSKLIISKFEGTNLDWLRFWSQFEMEIDRADITTVSKFLYLKE